jgi:hypothetical protein
MDAVQGSYAPPPSLKRQEEAPRRAAADEEQVERLATSASSLKDGGTQVFTLAVSPPPTAPPGSSAGTPAVARTLTRAPTSLSPNAAGAPLQGSGSKTLQPSGSKPALLRAASSKPPLPASGSKSALLQSGSRGVVVDPAQSSPLRPPSRPGIQPSTSVGSLQRQPSAAVANAEEGPPQPEADAEIKEALPAVQEQVRAAAFVRDLRASGPRSRLLMCVQATAEGYDPEQGLGLVLSSVQEYNGEPQVTAPLAAQRNDRTRMHPQFLRLRVTAYNNGNRLRSVPHCWAPTCLLSQLALAATSTATPSYGTFPSRRFGLHIVNGERADSAGAQVGLSGSLGVAEWKRAGTLTAFPALSTAIIIIEVRPLPARALRLARGPMARTDVMDCRSAAADVGSAAGWSATCRGASRVLAALCSLRLTPRTALAGLRARRKGTATCGFALCSGASVAGRTQPACMTRLADGRVEGVRLDVSAGIPDHSGSGRAALEAYGRMH